MKLSENHTAILSTYTQWLQMLGFSASIVYGYPKMVSHFLVWLQQNGIFHISHLTAAHLHHYYTYLENRPNQKVAGRGLSAAHLNKNFDAVDKLCECLHHMGMDQAPSPTQYRLAYKYSERPSVLTQQEVRDLYGAIPHTFAHHGLAAREPRQAILHLVLDLLYGCGLRRGEVTKLTLSDVDLDRKILHVRQAKGYKDRYVPLSKGVYRSIQLFVYQYRAYWSRRSGMLFPYTKHYLPFCLDILLRATDNQRLKQRKVTPHTLRHSVATHLLQGGMSIEGIARFLGHDTLESTQIYTRCVHEL